MSDRIDRLAAYFEKVVAEPWSWPRSNCLTFLGDWVEKERLGYDFSRWRGVCRAERDFLRIVREVGGTDALVAREARRAGLAEIAPVSARPGDVAMIRLPKLVDGSGRGGVARYGCVKSACGKWGIRTLEGLCLLGEDRVSPYRAWSL